MSRPIPTTKESINYERVQSLMYHSSCTYQGYWCVVLVRTRYRTSKYCSSSVYLLVFSSIIEKRQLSVRSIVRGVSSRCSYFTGSRCVAIPGTCGSCLSVVYRYMYSFFQYYQRRNNINLRRAKTYLRRAKTNLRRDKTYLRRVKTNVTCSKAQ